MPKNAERQVAALDLDAQEEMLVQEVQDLSRDDEDYALALKYLQRGLKEKEIADRLVSDGMSRFQARKLLERVLKENPQTQVSNAYILFGVAVFLALLAIIFLTLRLVDTGGLPLFSPAYIFLGLAVWFAYRGYKNLRAVK